MAMPTWAAKKIGPFPVWGWLGIGAAGIGLGFLMRRGFGGRDESPVPVTDDGELGAGLSGASGFESDAGFGDIQLGNIQEQLRQLALQEPGNGEVDKQASQSERLQEVRHQIQDLTARINGARAQRRKVKEQIDSVSARDKSTARTQALKRLQKRRREIEAEIVRLTHIRLTKRDIRDRLAA